MHDLNIYHKNAEKASVFFLLYDCFYLLLLILITIFFWFEIYVKTEHC